MLFQYLIRNSASKQPPPLSGFLSHSDGTVDWVHVNSRATCACAGILCFSLIAVHNMRFHSLCSPHVWEFPAALSPLGEMGAGHSSGLTRLQGAVQGQQGSRSFPPLLSVPTQTDPPRGGGKTGLRDKLKLFREAKPTGTLSVFNIIHEKC